MARIHTHYDNLKVARNAPPEVIRAAYKTLSQKYHPDRNPGNPDAIRIIKIINTAYETLSDPARRQEHDEWIAREEAAGAAEAQIRKAGAAGTGFGSGAGGAAGNASMRKQQHRHGGRSRHRSSFRPWDFIAQLLRLIVERFSKYIFRKV